MKNHYVSQFIIKRFSNAINIFDIKTGTIDESKRPDRVFYNEDAYDLEIEKAFNKNIESRVANIIDKKILNQNEIKITRDELLILKRYMLICSVRTLSAEEFCKTLKGFEENAKHYIDFAKCFGEDYSKLPCSSKLNISAEDLYKRTLNVFANTKFIKDIAENPLATREMLAWAMPFLESYMAIWDAPKEREFILTDCGMSTEYEGIHLLTGGVDISKTSYLWSKINDNHVEYSSILMTSEAMYENYNIFVISSTRMIVMINPFFKLYFDQCFQLPGLNRQVFEKPDIWPAVIQDRNLFKIPNVHYCMSELWHDEKDVFTYIPQILNNDDLIYINSLLLRYAKSIIGFNDPVKIIDSIYYFIWFQSNFNSVKSLNENEHVVINRLIENVINSPFHELCKYCETHGGINHSEFIILFEKLTNNIIKDFNENPYICKYCLDKATDTLACKNFDFLGNGEEKLRFFKNHLAKIEESRK